MVKLTREMKGMPVEGGLPVDLADDVFMGHEFSAEVLEAGPDTEALPLGTVVTSLPVLLSPKGFEPILSSNTTIGGYAERMLLSAPLLLPVPNGLDPRHAALTEPMAVGLHAVNKSSIQPGEDGPCYRVWTDRYRDRSPRCVVEAWKALWLPIIHTGGASWRRRWVHTRRWIPPRDHRSTMSNRQWCSRP